jgi:hypothetical protein
MLKQYELFDENKKVKVEVVLTTYEMLSVELSVFKSIEVRFNIPSTPAQCSLNAPSMLPQCSLWSCRCSIPLACGSMFPQRQLNVP